MKHMDVRKLIAPLCLGVLLLGGSGCEKKEGTVVNGGGGNSNLPVFDFSTKSTYKLNLNYNVPKGYQVKFEVYTENPVEIDSKGNEVKKVGLEPIDVAYTNENGEYNDRLVLPSYVKEVFIYSPRVGVPQLLTATVENGVLSDAALIPHPTTAAAPSSGTRAGMMVNKVNYPDVTTKLLGNWEHYLDGYASFPNVGRDILFDKKAKLWGRPSYMTTVDQTFFSGGKPAQMASADVLNTINKVLPGMDQPQSAYTVLDDGDIHVSQPATIDLHMLADRGMYLNVLAYYCYDTNNKPASTSDVKVQVIALPNAKIIRSHDFSYQGSAVYDYGAVCAGEGFRLRYIDQQGVDHGEEFPAGVSIGWILYANGYSLASNLGFGVPGKGYGPIYSDPSLMNGMKHVALFRHSDFVVLSFEDGVKTSVNDARDYDDVMFSVAASPASAITPGIPDENPDKPADNTVVSEVTYRGILAFEDIWPYRGDFDMNDVVVKYVSTVGYNINNEVLQTVEEYTPLGSGAELNNSFAYQNLNLMNGNATVTFEGGDGNASVDVRDKSIIRLAGRVLDYANQSTKKTFKVTTKYAAPIAKSDFVMPPYNPFITVNSKEGHEVHLTNMAPTSYADLALLGTGHDNSNKEKGVYYVTYNENQEQMPFGIDVVFDNDEAMSAFVIPQERKCINTYYEGFMGWILSGGKTNQDWYLHPKK